MNKYQLAQKALQNGATIEETCISLNIKFIDLCNYFHGYHRHRTPIRREYKTKTDIPYIQQRKGKCYIRKTHRGKTRYYGCYDSLEDAITIRDALKRDGWHQTHVDRICEEHGITRGKSKVRFR